MRPAQDASQIIASSDHQIAISTTLIARVSVLRTFGLQHCPLWTSRKDLQ